MANAGPAKLGNCGNIVPANVAGEPTIDVRRATASQGRFDQAILSHFQKGNDLITRDAWESIEKIVD